MKVEAKLEGYLSEEDWEGLKSDLKEIVDDWSEQFSLYVTAAEGKRWEGKRAKFVKLKGRIVVEINEEK